MTQALKALIVAPYDVPGEYGDYAAACQALNLELNEHCYVVCRVSTAAGPRTLLTVDLDLLHDTEKADTPDQASLLSAGRSTETASGPGQEPNPFGDFRRQEPPGGRTAGQPDHPVVQLVLDRERATLKGVAVWNPRTGQLGTATELEIATEAVDASVREAFADTAAEAIVGKLWPPHAAPPALADVDAALMALKGSLDPQTLLLKMINVAARVAAAHAGLGVVAPLVGNFAEDLCKQYVRPPRERILVNVLSSVDIDLYAAAGKLDDCAALRDLTREETSRGIENLFTARFGVGTPGCGPGVSTEEKRRADHTAHDSRAPVDHNANQAASAPEEPQEDRFEDAIGLFPEKRIEELIDAIGVFPREMIRASFVERLEAERDAARARRAAGADPQQVDRGEARQEASQAQAAQDRAAAGKKAAPKEDVTPEEPKGPEAISENKGAQERQATAVPRAPRGEAEVRSSSAYPAGPEKAGPSGHQIDVPSQSSQEPPGPG
jgi:hypothetical protein